MKNYKQMLFDKGYDIKELSELMELSYATVSHCLNDNDYIIKKETKEDIIKYIEELDYKPYCFVDLNDVLLKAKVKGIQIKDIAKVSGMNRHHISRVNSNKLKVTYQTKEAIIEAITKIVNERFG